MSGENEEILKLVDFEIQQQREAIKIPGWSKYVLLTSMAALFYYLANTLYSLKTFEVGPLLRGLLYCYALRILYVLFHIIKTWVSREKTKQITAFGGETAKAAEYQLFLLGMVTMTMWAMLWLFHGLLLWLVVLPGMEAISCIFTLAMMRAGIEMPLKVTQSKITSIGGFSLFLVWITGMLAALGTPTLVETQLCLGLFGLFWAYRVYCYLHKDEYALVMFIDLRREIAFGDKQCEKSEILERIHSIFWGASHKTLLMEVFREKFTRLDEAQQHLRDAQSLLDLMPKCSDEVLLKHSKDLVLARLQLVSAIWERAKKFDPKRTFGGNLVWTHADEASRAVVRAEVQRRLDAIGERRDKMLADPLLA